MRGKFTILLAVLAAALLLYITMFERKPGGRPASDAPARALILPDFSSTAAQAVQFSGRSNAVLRAERSGVGWRLTEPVPYAAKPAAVNAFLDALAKLDTGSIVEAADIRRQTNGLAAYGLEPPQSIVHIESGTNTHELRLGSFSAMGERLYFQYGDAGRVYTCDSNFFLALPRSAYDWRDPALLDLPEGGIDRMEVRAGSRGFELQRATNSGRWSITQPMSARADNNKLTHLFQQARLWSVTGFVTDAADADAQAFGLVPPSLEVAWHKGSNLVQRLQFGRSPTVTNEAQSGLTNFIYARRLPGSNVFLVSRTYHDVLAVPFNEFRDRHLADIQPSAVTGVEVRGEDAFTMQRQADGRWRVTEPLNFPADSSIVEDILLSVESIEVLEFVKDVVTDFNAYGLEAPQRRYTLHASQTNAAGVVSNRTLIELDIGTNVAERVYARRRDEDSVYSIPYGTILRLPQARFEVRDRVLNTFPLTNAVSVTYREHDRERRLTRNANGDWESGSGDEVNTFAVKETLQRLSELSVSAWTARGKDKLGAYGFDRRQQSVEIGYTTDGEPKVARIDFGGLSMQRRPFGAMVIDGETIIFEIPESVYDHVEAFLGLPKPK